MHPPAGLYGIIALAAMERNAIALKADGTVVQWGLQAGSVPSGLSNVVAISAGSSSGMALRNDGTLAVWGSPAMYPAALNGLSNVIGMAAVGPGGLAVRGDGSLTYGGYLSGGPFGTGYSTLAGFSNVVAISAGTYGLALKNDGTVQAYGAEIPSGLEHIYSIAAGFGYSLLLATNPPAPRLLATGGGSNVGLSAAVAVSGYALQAGNSPSGPFTTIETFTKSRPETNAPR